MTKITFENLPSTNTPLNATNLNQLQTNVENAINEFTESVDTNGWIVLDYGKYKEYVRRININKTISGNTWGSQYISNLPEGLSTLGNRILTYSGKSSDSAISVNVGADTSDTGITITYRNNYSGSVTTTITVDLRLLEFRQN